MAVDALERLQGAHRSVGVITHVDAMAERIPSGLQVTPSANGGSTITART